MTDDEWIVGGLLILFLVPFVLGLLWLASHLWMPNPPMSY